MVTSWVRRWYLTLQKGLTPPSALSDLHPCQLTNLTAVPRSLARRERALAQAPRGEAERTGREELLSSRLECSATTQSLRDPAQSAETRPASPRTGADDYTRHSGCCDSSRPGLPGPRLEWDSHLWPLGVVVCTVENSGLELLRANTGLFLTRERGSWICSQEKGEHASTPQQDRAHSPPEDDQGPAGDQAATMSESLSIMTVTSGAYSGGRSPRAEGRRQTGQLQGVRGQARAALAGSEGG